MNILHLRYAVEVASTGSISKAAENLYMNQPNLSRAIKELEDSLGITVFDRTARGITLTADGGEFLNYAKDILDRIDEVEAIYSKDRGAKLRFSVSVPCTDYIADAFSAFVGGLDKKAAAELSYSECDSEESVRRVLHDDCGIGIIRYAAVYDGHFKKMLEEKGLEFEVVAEFSSVAAMSAKHVLAQKESICLDDLKPFTELVSFDSYVPFVPISAVKKEELRTGTDKRIFIHDRASLCSLLASDSDSFAWTCPLSEETVGRYGLVMKSCSDYEKKYKDILIYRKGYNMTELDKKFVTELCTAKRRAL